MKQAYQQLLDSKKLSYDQAQVSAVDALAHLSSKLLSININLTDSSSSPNSSTKYRTLFSFKSTEGSIRGLYLYGRVGRGKTMLMDLFYQNVAIENKKRIHFHHFMESVHLKLKELEGASNPLDIIASQWAKDIKLLCFDEFFVSDIADAMLLAGLFSALFEHGMVLVATSNCQPEQLYLNGLQRDRFLPTIALLNQYCDVISIDGDVDHRCEYFQSPNEYSNYYLMTENGNNQLKDKFLGLTEELMFQRSNSDVMLVVNINHRDITYIAKKGSIIWFDFFALCSGPRSQRDYIQLAKEYATVFLSNVPQFSGNLIPAVFSGVEDSYQRSGVLLGELRQLDDEARRFIALVDEFYDQKINLYISAEVDIPKLYQGNQLSFEFERCKSRLYEMQKS
jgi:cell division protein ZapE